MTRSNSSRFINVDRNGCGCAPSLFPYFHEEAGAIRIYDLESAYLSNLNRLGLIVFIPSIFIYSLEDQIFKM